MKASWMRLHSQIHSVKLARDDTVAPGHIGTCGGRDAATHRLTILVKPPLRVGTWDEAALGVPTGDPVDAIVEEEEAQLLRVAALVQRSRKPAAALLELGLEHVSVEDAAVDQGNGGLFVVFASITVDEMPAAAWEELVCSGDGGLPVSFFINIAVGASALLEPVGRTACVAQADKKVGGHGW